MCKTLTIPNQLQTCLKMYNIKKCLVFSFIESRNVDYSIFNCQKKILCQKNTKQIISEKKHMRNGIETERKKWFIMSMYLSHFNSGKLCSPIRHFTLIASAKPIPTQSSAMNLSAVIPFWLDRLRTVFMFIIQKHTMLPLLLFCCCCYCSECFSHLSLHSNLNELKCIIFTSFQST